MKHVSVDSCQLVVIVTRRPVACLSQVIRHFPPNNRRQGEGRRQRWPHRIPFRPGGKENITCPSM